MNKITRRDYLKASAAIGGSFFLPRFAIGQSGMSANSKLNIALIGSGGIAKSAFGNLRDDNVIAIAEVDEIRGAPGFEEFPSAKRYKDFRRMLDAHYKELDLVIISTPDHHHFAATFACMERGIAVHTQKPLVHNIWQARTLQAAAHKFDVQTVMGNQGHNLEGMRLIKDWYDAGLAGDVTEVHAWTSRNTTNNSNAERQLPGEDVPSTLDWDLWQGATPEQPYNKRYCPGGWRWFWEYGCGALGDIGCHTLDVPMYSMGLDYPTAVYMSDIDHRSEFDGEEAKSSGATYIYEFPAANGRPAVKVYWYEGGRMPRFPQQILDLSPQKKEKLVEGGCFLVGNKNTIWAPGMRPVSPRMLNDWDTIRRQLNDYKTTPRAVGNPVKEIIAACKGEIPKCGSNFKDYAAKLTEVVILGTLATRSQKRIEYRPETMDFTDPSLNHYIKEPVRPGWEYGEGLV